MALHKMVNGVKVDLTPAEEAAIRAEWAANEQRQAATAYKDARVQAYPPVGDQLDAIWQILKNSPAVGPPEAEAIRASIEAVKIQYPKPK